MYYDKEKYEKLIIDSPLFYIDKEESPTLFDREKYRLLENLYCYLMATNANKYEPYSCEILKVSEDCIRAYDATKGVFLHYFNAAWKQEYSHICGRKIIEERLAGMTKITAEEKRIIVGLIRYREKTKKENSHLSEDDILHEYSEATGVSIDKIRYIAEIEAAKVVDIQVANNDGDQQSIIDQLPDEERLEDSLIQTDNIEEIIGNIEEAFEKLQERQKDLISDLITAKLCPIIADVLSVKTPIFISKGIIDIYYSTGNIPSQKEIGAKYGKVEASVSRTYKVFIENVKSQKD